ncbi:MAG TPA: DUF1592 domain-containing protein [Vicinamibacterales bacterium]|nr:DUF1592 domain-containing protein [Vicinamibacterales bacterium]
MHTRSVVAAIAVWVTVMAIAAPRASDRASSPRERITASGPKGPGLRPPTVDVTAANEAMVAQYCVVCHNDRLKTGGLVLDPSALADVGKHADTFEKIVRKLRAGLMPPQGARRPGPEALQGFVAWLEGSLDRAAARTPNPGRPMLHRLNRTEYANAIRDLLGIEVDAATLLPPDDSAYGFDNVSDVLGVSPSLQERYLSAAETISALAVGDTHVPPGSDTYRVRQDLSQDEHIEGLPLGTVGGTAIRHFFPVDGEYEFQTKLYRTNLNIVRGLEYPTDFEVAVDGRPVHHVTIGGNEDLAALFEAPSDAGDAIEKRMRVRVPVTAGEHTVTATFIGNLPLKDSVRLQPFLRSSADNFDWTGQPHIQTVTIAGPFDVSGPGDTASRRAIFVCRPDAGAASRTPAYVPPAGAASRTPAYVPSVRRAGSAEGGPAGVSAKTAGGPAESACARRILSRLARRAYRRPVTDADLRPILQFYAAGRKAGSFDAGIERGVERILASPYFVFRVERDPAGVTAGTPYRISDVELASRLSFFLWSSIPDETLLRLAEQGRLKNDAVLDAQVRRMLADPKASALVSNFAGQWLQLRNVRSVQPNSDLFPDFDDNLRESMRRETELFFQSIVTEDRSVLDLLTADYTFVNERLARHYGIAGIYGSRFRRVHVADEARRGLLGQASILAVTSHAERTSPVLRGKWVLENLLGLPVPPPPPDVPQLPAQGAIPKTLRAQMELHRASPVCASCHKVMDPIGFALENFDAVGAWRTREPGGPIDASGQLADGTHIDGVVELRDAIVAHPENFVGTMTEKMMIYALGRGVESYDMPALRAIVRASARDHYRFSSIVRGIVHSLPFQMRIKPVATTETR